MAGYGTPMMRRGGGGAAAGVSNRAPGSPGGYIANLTDLVNFQVNWNQWEALTQSIYDSSAYASAGTTQATFFALPQGQGTGRGGGAKTATDTNMVLAGQMPANQMFLIGEIEVDFLPTTPTVAGQLPADFGAQAAASIVNDAYIFYRGGNLILSIGSKPYMTEAPLMKFPPMSVFEVQGALADTTTAAAASQSRISFAGARGQPYTLAPNNLLLVSSQNFSVQLNWPEGVQAITNPAWVYVTLNGTLYRKAQ